MVRVVRDGREPGPDHSIHHYIEDGGGYNIPLSDTSGGPERPAMVTTLSSYNTLVVPVRPQESKDPGPHAISLEDDQGTLLVKRVKRLSEIKKDLVERDLLASSELLDKLCFNNGSVGASSREASMQGVVKGDGADKALVDNLRNYLPGHLY